MPELNALIKTNTMEEKRDLFDLTTSPLLNDYFDVFSSILTLKNI